MEELLLPVGISAIAGAILGVVVAYFLPSLPMALGFLGGGGLGALFGLFLVFKG